MITFLFLALVYSGISSNMLRVRNKGTNRFSMSLQVSTPSTIFDFTVMLAAHVGHTPKKMRSELQTAVKRRGLIGFLFVVHVWSSC